jgi:hypothetical protein
MRIGDRQLKFLLKRRSVTQVTLAGFWRERQLLAVRLLLQLQHVRADVRFQAALQSLRVNDHTELE